MGSCLSYYKMWKRASTHVNIDREAFKIVNLLKPNTPGGGVFHVTFYGVKRYYLDPGLTFVIWKEFEIIHVIFKDCPYTIKKSEIQNGKCTFEFDVYNDRIGNYTVTLCIQTGGIECGFEWRHRSNGNSLQYQCINE